MNEAVKKMIENPGYYRISVPGSRRFVLVEVDEDHNVHQLNPSMQRDGILSNDGWNPLTTATRLTSGDQ